MSSVEVRPVYKALVVIVVVLVVVHIAVDLALLCVLVLNVAVGSVIVLVVGYVLLELMLLHSGALHDAVELLCSRRLPSCVGGGSGQADLLRKGLS